MKAHRCYDLIPTSTKVVVFDTQLSVRKAFFALVYNGVRAAPLWDSVRQEFVGMLTITDFIHILYKYYKSGETGVKELEEHQIATWRDVMQKDGKEKEVMISIDPTERLSKAVLMLYEKKIHRLPVVDKLSGNVLYILTHKRILRFLFLYLHDLPRPSFMEKNPRELSIGTWDNVETVTPATPLIVALTKFLEKRVSALPIVDPEGRVVDIYAKFDVINLAAEKAYNNLDITVHEALKYRSGWFEGVRTCSTEDSLAVVLDTLVKAEVHRMIITDGDKRVAGIVSLSDILAHLILTPHLLPASGLEDGEDMDQ
jgi:5'-AMP-activated protein kinase regulatory gamma subunit